MTTPESYLGGAKAQTIVDRLRPGVHSYTLPASGSPPPDRIALGGSWRLAADSATAVSGASLQLNFGARRVFLVLGSAGGRPRSLQVRLDGQPISTADAGSDVHAGTDGLGTRYRAGEVAVEVEAGIHAEQAVEEGLPDQLGARRTGQVGRREAGWKLPVADRDHAALVACRLGLVVGGGSQRRGGGGGRGWCGAGTAGRAGRDYEDQSCCAPRPPPPRCARHLPTVWGGVSG